MALDNIVVVLVGTLYGGNVGSTCRAMANMGIRELRLVNPREAIEWEDAKAFRLYTTFIRRCATMAQKVTGFIKLQIEAGKANPPPPVGPALGQHGVNNMQFC